MINTSISQIESRVNSRSETLIYSRIKNLKDNVRNFNNNNSN